MAELRMDALGEAAWLPAVVIGSRGLPKGKQSPKLLKCDPYQGLAPCVPGDSKGKCSEIVI